MVSEPQDGSSQPKTTDGDAKPESQWTLDKRRVVVQDQRLKSIILSCLPDDITESIISCVLAKETWTDLVKVLVALADDELTVGKSHAQNGEWVDITIRKVNNLLSMDEDVDWQNYLKDELLSLKQAKLDVVTFQIQNTELTKLNHALQEQLKEEKKINEKWLTSSKKVSQCISEQILHQKKKVLGGSFSKIRGNAIELSTLLSKRETMLRERIPDISYFHMFGCLVFIHNQKDHLGKFDAKADDGYLLRYSSILKYFKVYKTRIQQIEETYHVIFDESIEAIRFTNTLVDEIGIDDSSRYPPDEFLHEDDPSRKYQVDSNISHYVIPHGRSLTELTQENHVHKVIILNEHDVPLTEDIEDPPDLINTKRTHEQNV
nr:retrovirus-related Pol polyprotein from transposon TNT 1-94 [Tanacetum cinerariifolium]